MASNALGSNQPDIIVQQEIFGVESGGDDSMDLAPVAPNPLGLEMPGIPMGIDTPDVMVGMAGMENIGHGPNMGTTSDSGQMARDDMSVSAGFHMVTTDYGNNGFVASGVPDFASAPAPITGNQNVGNSDLDNDSD